MKKEGLEPIRDGEVVKLQRPLDNTYSNINNGFGTCNNCGLENADINNHICQTVLNLDNNFFTSYNEFKKYYNKK